MKKFHIVIIDSGWPTAAHEILQKSMKALKEFLSGHHLIIFSEEEAQDFLRNHPQEIGKDPLIIITDTNPKKISAETEHLKGIRIDLGKIAEGREVIAYLQEICRFIKDDRFIADISWEERKKITRLLVEEVAGGIFTKILEFTI